jgi:hypothetical protein
MFICSLLDEGFAQEDIDEAARTAREVRKSIVESCSKKYWDRINERLEATSRVIAKAVVERVRRVRKEDSLCQWNVANMERLNRGNLVTLIKGELAKDDTNANDESNATDVAVETPLQCNNRIVSAKTESLHQNIAKLESLNRGGFQMSMPIAIRKQQRSASTA